MSDTVNEQVILVDEQDNETGLMDKMEAHQKGLLHRAISVFILNDKRELLLQQRADGKYHSPGLWTNTCCTHPRQGESVRSAAARRLQEEMGMEAKLKKAFSFIYNAPMGNGLVEHEYDHVFIGHSNSQPVPDEHEVKAWRYVSVDVLDKEIKLQPGKFTEWFKICYEDHFFEIFK